MFRFHVHVHRCALGTCWFEPSSSSFYLNWLSKHIQTHFPQWRPNSGAESIPCATVDNMTNHTLRLHHNVPTWLHIESLMYTLFNNLPPSCISANSSTSYNYHNIFLSIDQRDIANKTTNELVASKPAGLRLEVWNIPQKYLESTLNIN